MAPLAPPMCCLSSETFTALDDFQLIRQHPARRYLIYFRGPIVRRYCAWGRCVREERLVGSEQKICTRGILIYRLIKPLLGKEPPLWR